MKRIIFILISIFSTTVLSATISGPTARKLYQLMPVTAHKILSPVPMVIKQFDDNVCSERVEISDATATESHHYLCSLPAPVNNRIRLSQEFSRVLFNVLGEQQVKTIVTTSCNAAINERRDGAISCSEIEYIGATTTHKCVIDI